MSGRKGRYAEGTTTSVDDSIAEIRRLLDRFEAEAFITGYTTLPDGRRQHSVMFERKGQRVRLGIIMPQERERDIMYDGAGRWRDDARRRAAMEREVLRRWRVLVLQIKNRLVTIDELERAGQPDAFRREFLPETVLPNNATVAEWADEQGIATFAQRMPPLLPGASLALPAPRGEGS